MLILSLTYCVPPDQVEPQMKAHMDWVNDGYAKGWFLASGRKIPRTGGTILAKGEGAVIEDFCQTDPFVTHGLAAYEITELTLTRVVDGLEALK